MAGVMYYQGSGCSGPGVVGISVGRNAAVLFTAPLKTLSACS